MIGSLRQRHALPMMAPTAILRCVGRIHSNICPTSFCRFAGELTEKCRPRSICNALSQTVVMDHTIDVQVFHADDHIGVDDLATLLMREVFSPKGDTFMHPRYGLSVLSPLRSSLSQFAVLALHFGKRLFFPAKETRIRYLFPIRQGSERLESYINADLRGAFGLHVTGERSVPFTCTTPMYGKCFDLAFDGTVIDHLDGADLGEAHPVVMRDAEAGLGVGKAIIASIALEPKKARVFPSFNTSEEGLKGRDTVA